MANETGTAILIEKTLVVVATGTFSVNETGTGIAIHNAILAAGVGTTKPAARTGTGTGIFVKPVLSIFGTSSLPGEVGIAVLTLPRAYSQLIGSVTIVRSGAGIAFFGAPDALVSLFYDNPTTSSWPASLSTKFFAVGGYQEDVSVDPIVQTKMDSGPAKFRRRFTTVPKTFTGTLQDLTSTDVTNLLFFYETNCQWGTLPFTWVYPRTGATATYRWVKYPKITTQSGSGIIFSADLSLIVIP
jgi:hypothetical protein